MIISSRIVRSGLKISYWRNRFLRFNGGLNVFLIRDSYSTFITQEWKNQCLSEKLLRSPFPINPIPEMSLVEFMFTKMEKYGSKTMMIDGLNGSKISYHEVIQNATKIASALLKRGLKYGDKVAIYSFNDINYFVTFLGVLAAGCVNVDINPNSVERELRDQLITADCNYIIAHSVCANVAKKVASSLPLVKEVIVLGQIDGCTPFSELLLDDGLGFKHLPNIGDPRKSIVHLPCSSGTTGLPKLVVKSDYSMVAMALAGHDPEIALSNSDDVGLLVLPQYHTFAAWMILHSVVQGSTTVLLPNFNPATFLNAIQKYRITVVPLVPPILLFLHQHDIVNNFDLSSLKRISCGAAPVSSEILKQIEQRFKVGVKQGYGMTEICPASLSLNENHKYSDIGVPVQNTEIKFLDVDTGKQLGPNTPGEILIKGPAKFNEYYNNPESTLATIDKEGWVHSGDIGYYNDNCEMYIVDRLKDLVKYKGHQVAPAELEAILLGHPSVQDVAVVGLPDERAGELTRAYIVLKDGEIEGKVLEEQICKFVADQTSSEKHLYGGVKFLKSIPKSAAGKILKKELRNKKF